LGLKYNGSLFHNNTSTLIWDNPLNTSGVGSACVDSATYAAGSGPCRGRFDLYPSNQAHMFTLTGTANSVQDQPHGHRFLWLRLQDDLFTLYDNSAVTQPSISRTASRDVRPTTSPDVGQ
jgi:hypothetical protein